MIGIYKITNNINQHAYIGKSVHIEKRWQQHKNPYNWKRECRKPLYQAFQKYGIKNFTFEVVEECEIEQLDAHEQYWIEKYNTMTDGYNLTAGGEGSYGENHPGHKLTEQDVRNIRTRYNNLERKKEVYLDYNNRIGESGFAKIWKGETWTTVMPEVYTPENKKYHANNTGNSGSTNGRARLTEQEVRDIRLQRKNGADRQEVYKQYQDKLTKGSFENVWYYQNWKNVIV